MAINFYEDLTVYNHVYVEGGFYAGTAVDLNYDLKIKGASLLENTLAVSGIVTLSSVANAASDPDKFLCINGSNQVEYRTGAEVLSDIGAASSSSLNNYLPLAGGTMTGTTSHGDNVKSIFGTGNDLEIYHDGSNSIIKDTGTGDLRLAGNVVRIRNAADTENMISCVQDGEVALAYNNATKLQTTSIGIDVTGDVTLSNGNALRWTSDDVRIEGTTAGDKIQFYVGNSEILRLEQAGPLSTFTSNLAVTGGDLSLASGVSVLSNATTASTLNIGDISGNDEITLINFKTYGNILMAIDDDLVTVSAAEFSIGSTTAVTFGTDSHIVYSHAGSSTGLANGNTIKLGSSVTTAGLVYYLSSSTTWATAANTSSNSTKMLGVATGTSSSSGMLLQGVFTKATHGFTIGAPLYISSSGGSLTTTVPTATNSYARVVGYAVDTNNIYFCPDNTWVQNT